MYNFENPVAKPRLCTDGDFSGIASFPSRTLCHLVPISKLFLNDRQMSPVSSFKAVGLVLGLGIDIIK